MRRTQRVQQNLHRIVYLRSCDIEMVTTLHSLRSTMARDAWKFGNNANGASNSTSGIYLWCNTITFTTPDISAFFCNYIATSTAIPAETTYSGQVGHAFTMTIAKFATTPAPSTSHSSATTTTFPSTANSATVTPSQSDITKKSNRGAIIGGVVGGLLGLALIVGAVIMRTKKRNSQEPAQQQKGTASSTEEVSATDGVKTRPTVSVSRN